MRSPRKRVIWVLQISAIVTLGLVLASHLFGQATTFGSILGKVTDPTGSSVPGATVRVMNTDTGITRELQTDGAGDFAARSLNPGTYNIEVSAPNFQKQVQEGVKLDVAKTVTLDFHLTIGQVSESVQVQAVAPLLQSDNGTVGTVIENAKVLELPLNGRDFNQLTRLVPGAVRGSNWGGEAIQGDTYSVTGTRSDDNYYSLDGMYNNSTFFKASPNSKPRAPHNSLKPSPPPQPRQK